MHFFQTVCVHFFQTEMEYKILNAEMECQVKWIHFIWMYFTIDIYF